MTKKKQILIDFRPHLFSIKVQNFVLKMNTSDSVQDATHQLEFGDNKRNPLGPEMEDGNRSTKTEKLSSNDIMVQQK